jgi:hypothetical protein
MPSTLASDSAEPANSAEQLVREILRRRRLELAQEVPLPPEDPQELLKLIKAFWEFISSDGASEMLLKRVKRQATAVARHGHYQEADAGDICHDTLLKAIEKLQAQYMSNATTFSFDPDNEQISLLSCWRRSRSASFRRLGRGFGCRQRQPKRARGDGRGDAAVDVRRPHSAASLGQG